MVATFIVEEVTHAGRRAAGAISRGLQKAEPFLGGPKVVRPIDKIQTKTFDLGVRVSAWTIPKLFRFWHFARVELRPPRLREMGEVSQGFSNLKAGFRTGAWKNVTVSEATVNMFVTMELLMWFFAGECIGKGTVIGYQFPGAVHMELEF